MLFYRRVNRPAVNRLDPESRDRKFDPHSSNINSLSDGKINHATLVSTDFVENTTGRLLELERLQYLALSSIKQED